MKRPPGGVARLIRILVLTAWLAVPLLPMLVLTGFGGVRAGLRALVGVWPS